MNDTPLFSSGQPQAPTGVTLVNWSFRTKTSPYRFGTLDPMISHLRKLDKILGACHGVFAIATIDDQQEASLHFLLQYGEPTDIQRYVTNYFGILQMLQPAPPRLEEMRLGEAVRQVLRPRPRNTPDQTTESLLAKFRQVVTQDYLVPLIEDAEYSVDPIEKNRKLTAALLSDQLQARLLPGFVSRLVDPRRGLADDDEQLDAILRLAREVQKMLPARQVEPPEAPQLAVFPQARAS